MENKLEYIQKKITNNEISTDSIMNFVSKYNIIYSQNQNGIFINLSKIDKAVIDIFYEYVYNYINQNITEEYNIDYYKQFNKDNYTKKEKVKKVYIKKTGLTDIQKQIIKLSKDI